MNALIYVGKNGNVTGIVKQVELTPKRSSTFTFSAVSGRLTVEETNTRGRRSARTATNDEKRIFINSLSWEKEQAELDLRRDGSISKLFGWANPPSHKLVVKEKRLALALRAAEPLLESTASLASA